MERLINPDLSFELNLEQKIAVNCLLEGRDVFAVMPTAFAKSFFWLFSTAITQKNTDLGRKVSELWEFSYLPIDRPD